MAKQNKSTFQRLTHRQLNRKQRRELERRLSTEDPGLEIVNRNVAGIDVGNKSHYVAVPPGRDAQERSGQNLQRHVTLERRVACAVHFAHAALADQRDDFVVTEFIAD